jgi:AraC-like DNA-binding protein
MKQELGFTVGDDLTKVRVDRAKRLLDESEYPISQIAQEVGFSDQSYFTKVFKKLEQCTPREFRQNVQVPLLSERQLIRQSEGTGPAGFPKGTTEIQ